MIYENTTHVTKTEVLVLGSGAAGCGAAIAAKEQGKKVLLLDKGKIESSGCLGGGNDHFMANMNSGPDWDTDEAVAGFFQGFRNGLTRTMILHGWTKTIPVILQLLEQIGLLFVRENDGSYLRTVGFGQPGPWFINIENGQVVKRLLAKKVRQMGIEVLDHVMVTKLITDNGRIMGALGYNVLDGSFYCLHAKSVVIALGNNNARVTNNSTRNPFNTWQYPYNCGSNTVLPYECGAEIINADIDEGATLLPKSFGCPGMNGLNSMGGHELNALGERFMGKYDPMMENGLRKNQVLGTYQELIEGKGPPFYMDMRHLSKEDLDLLGNVLMPGDKATYTDWMEQKQLNFATHPLEVELSEISFGGKPRVGEDFESTIEGLFSGCNFFSFSGAICGGYSAGIEASRAADEITQMPQIEGLQIEEEKNSVFAPLGKGEGIKPASFENAIRQVMDYYMGYVRNQKGMETALERLSLIESRKRELQADNLHELMRANEAIQILKHCQIVTRACMERKESGRSIYRRSDYPEKDESFSKALLIWQEHGKPQTRFAAL